MGVGFVKIYNAELDRYSVTAETAWPHMPGWAPVEPIVVKAHPWDFEEPDPDDDTAPPEDAVPELGPPTDDLAEPPAGNAAAAEWRAYAEARGIANAADYSRDDLRAYFLSDQPLPSKES